MNQEKRTWRAPELIDVGRVVDVTEGMVTNGRDNQGETPVTYSINRIDGPDEVELGPALHLV